MSIWYDEKCNPELTVDELIKRLVKLSEKGYGNLKVRFYEKGSVYDKPVVRAYKKEDDIILQNY